MIMAKPLLWWKPVAFALVVFAMIVGVMIVALVAVPGVGPSMQAQEPVATVAVDVKVVTLPVTVRDKHGKIVRDLTKDDFTLQEDGRPQTIKYFSQETNLPLTLGLLVDTSRSQDNVLDAERNASRSFIDQMLVQPKDKAFLIHFDREVELLQDLTASREKLQSALELLKTSSDREHSNDPNDPSNSPSGSGSHRGGGTQLYDAVYLASNELMKKQQGRKAIVILSDGVDHGSKTYLESAIEAAQRADTVVYSIYFADSHRDEGQRQGGGMGRGGGYPGWRWWWLARWRRRLAGRRRWCEAVVEANVLPRAAPTARKFLSGFPKKLVDVSLRFLKKNPSAISTPALSRNYEPSTAWVIHPTRTAPPPVITTSCWR